MMQIDIPLLVLSILNKLNDEQQYISDDTNLIEYIERYLKELDIPNSIFIEIKK